VVTGSTRMKAGTATKLVLNTLTTGAMIRIGKTYGNLMVDVRAWNAKLEDRSRRILMEVAGLTRADAAELLLQAGGSVKTALVMAACEVDSVEAERLIAEQQGRLRPLLGEPPPVRMS
jgi:N-acetylmuramic acid 6-phosphate etherase